MVSKKMTADGSVLACAVLFSALLADAMASPGPSGAEPAGVDRGGSEPPPSLSVTPSETDAARRRRDLVMPLLWATRDAPEDPLAAQMAAYAPLTRTLQLMSTVSPASEEGDQEPTPSTASAVIPLTLEGSVDTALEHNLRVQVARLTKEAAEADVAGAKAKFHPRLGLGFLQEEGEAVVTQDSGLESTVTPRVQSASAILSQEIPTGGTAVVSGDLVYDEGIIVDSHDAGVTVSIVQPLLRGGRIYVARQPIRDAEYDLEVEEARLRTETLLMIADTKTAYYNTLLAEKIIRVTLEAIERDKALIEASQALFDAGLVTKRDVYSAEILLANDRAKLAGAEGDLELVRNDLLDLLGLPISQPVELVDRDISFEPISLKPDEWITAAVQNRPEVYEIRARMEKTQLSLGVARNERWPALDVVGSYGRSQSGLSRSAALELDRYAWSAGVVFSLPIGSAEARAAARRAELEQERLERELQDTKRRIELDVRASTIKLRTSVQKMAALQVGVEQAQGKLEIARERFALGLATNLDITDAQENLLGAETDLLTAIVDYNIGLAELEASIAGPIS
jgi:outer membrane protein TolC